MNSIKIIAPLIFLLCFYGNVDAQVFQTMEKRRLQEAQEAYQSEEYLRAIDLYKKSLSVKETREAVQGLAMANYHLKNYEGASEGFFYLKEKYTLMSEEIIPYFETLVKLNDFAQARVIYQLSRFSNRIQVSQVDQDRMLKILDINENPKADNTVASIVPLENLNSKYRDFALILNGDTQYFVSNRPEKFFEGSANAFENLTYKVYQGNSELEVGQSPKVVGFIENKEQHGAITFSDEFVFYSASEVEVKKGLKSLLSSETEVPYPEIFAREILKDGEYGPEFRLWKSNSGNYAMIDPHWDSERQILIFSSDMPGGFGGLDLYAMNYLGNRKWSKPTNLGKNINSDNDERSPFVNDSKLYFSSNGHGGFGGYDVFFSNISPKGYDLPENMLFPINSSGDDLFFSIIKNPEEETAFVSSNRTGNDDIFKIAFRNKSTQDLEVRLFDKEYNTPLSNVEIKLFDGNQTNDFETDNSGEFMLTANQENKRDFVWITLNGYEPIKAILPTTSTPVDKSNLGMVRVNEKKQVLLNKGFDSSDQLLVDENLEKLERLFLLLQSNQDLAVEIFSYTDTRGYAYANKKKSDKRATEIKSFLVKRGIEKERIQTIGEGSKNPINDCLPGLPCSDEEHSENDRVEFQISKSEK